MLRAVLRLLAAAVLIAVAAAEVASSAMVRDGELLLVLGREACLVRCTGEIILRVAWGCWRRRLDRLGQGGRALIGGLLGLGMVVVGMPWDGR